MCEHKYIIDIGLNLNMKTFYCKKCKKYFTWNEIFIYKIVI